MARSVRAQDRCGLVGYGRYLRQPLRVVVPREDDNGLPRRRAVKQPLGKDVVRDEYIGIFSHAKFAKPAKFIFARRLCALCELCVRHKPRTRHNVERLFAKALQPEHQPASTGTRRLEGNLLSEECRRIHVDPLILGRCDSLAVRVLKPPEPCHRGGTPPVVEYVDVVLDFRPLVEARIALDVHDVDFRRNAPLGVDVVPAPRRPERHVCIAMPTHRLDFRLDVPLVAVSGIVENLVARETRPSERRIEEEVPARLVDENRLLAPFGRRIGVDVADLQDLPGGNRLPFHERLFDIAPVERIRHVAPGLAQGEQLDRIVRRDYVVLAAQIEVAARFGEVERIERADVPQRGLDWPQITVFALGVVFVRDIPRHDGRMVAQGRGEAAVVVLLPRPELLVRALFGRWIRDRRETYGAGNPRLVAEIKKLRRVVDVPQKLDASQLAFP